MVATASGPCDTYAFSSHPSPTFRTLYGRLVPAFCGHKSHNAYDQSFDMTNNTPQNQRSPKPMQWPEADGKRH